MVTILAYILYYLAGWRFRRDWGGGGGGGEALELETCPGAVEGEGRGYGELGG